MSVVIRNNKFFSRDWVYDEAKEKGAYVETPIQGIQILRFWSSSLEEVEKTTFGKLIQTLNKSQGLLELISWLSDSEIPKYLPELKKSPKGKKEKPFQQIVIESVMEIWKDEETDNSFSRYIGASGRIRNTKDNFAIAYTHWWYLRNAQLVLNDKTSITTYPGQTNGVEYEVLEVQDSITLGEFINGLFFEVCWCGTPEKRDAFVGKLHGQLEEIRNGTAKLTEWDPNIDS